MALSQWFWWYVSPVVDLWLCPLNAGHRKQDVMYNIFKTLLCKSLYKTFALFASYNYFLFIYSFNASVPVAARAEGFVFSSNPSIIVNVKSQEHFKGFSSNIAQMFTLTHSWTWRPRTDTLWPDVGHTCECKKKIWSNTLWSIEVKVTLTWNLVSTRISECVKFDSDLHLDSRVNCLNFWGWRSLQPYTLWSCSIEGNLASVKGVLGTTTWPLPSQTGSCAFKANVLLICNLLPIYLSILYSPNS